MTSPFGPIVLIANPSAGRGRGAVLPPLQAALDEQGLAYELELTDAPGHAIELARDAVTRRDRRFVVALGGDGTVHEVVNGLVDAEAGRAHREDAVLGLVAGGSGSDFMRTFGLPRDPRLAVRHLTGDSLFPIDVGRVRYRDADGNEQVRVFANIAEVGWGADVTERANQLPRWVGGARYVIATFGTTARMQQVMTTVTVDHTEVSEPVSEIVVANGQFFGRGMKVAPRALPDDGSFNVQTWRSKPSDVLRDLPKVRVGEHLGRPDIREWQSRTVRVEAESPLTVEADGEVLGTTPVTFEVLDKVLQLKV